MRRTSANGRWLISIESANGRGEPSPTCVPGDDGARRDFDFSGPASRTASPQSVPQRRLMSASISPLVLGRVRHPAGPPARTRLCERSYTAHVKFDAVDHNLRWTPGSVSSVCLIVLLFFFSPQTSPPSFMTASGWASDKAFGGQIDFMVPAVAAQLSIASLFDGNAPCSTGLGPKFAPSRGLGSVPAGVETQHPNRA